MFKGSRILRELEDVEEHPTKMSLKESRKELSIPGWLNESVDNVLGINAKCKKQKLHSYYNIVRA